MKPIFRDYMKSSRNRGFYRWKYLKARKEAQIKQSYIEYRFDLEELREKAAMWDKFLDRTIGALVYMHGDKLINEILANFTKADYLQFKKALIALVKTKGEEVLLTAINKKDYFYDRQGNSYHGEQSRLAALIQHSVTEAVEKHMGADEFKHKVSDRIFDLMKGAIDNL